ncbi:hypothetical protein [Phenylobacterium sp. J367]|uniref:hypothetical protein n=1 Tax=Phenylobacterium sp. J367 TaxID=2898435 RepID=UPI0021517B47|nr:hypothetical protein [Phenylobacterium sp. J367]MCR5878739.1 hypothetical protein [Phenylobacterium sp. J367]
MKTFRAYLQDASGALTWAAWIEAANGDEALRRALVLSPGQDPTVELWSATERKLDASATLDPV